MECAAVCLLQVLFFPHGLCSRPYIFISIHLLQGFVPSESDPLASAKPSFWTNRWTRAMASVATGVALPNLKGSSFGQTLRQRGTRFFLGSAPGSGHQPPLEDDHPCDTRFFLPHFDFWEGGNGSKLPCDHREDMSLTMTNLRGFVTFPWIGVLF